jgi:hypothetical protein
MPRYSNQKGFEQGRAVGPVRKTCSFEQLLLFLNMQLDLDRQLEVYDHLDRCDICRDAVYQLSRDQDGALLLFRTA